LFTWNNMKKLGIKISFLAIALFSLATLHSCKNDNPSIVKVFVRSASNDLVEGAKVIIIGDVSSTPPTMEYVDTAYTNVSGFTSINVQPYYDAAGEEENPVAYFDIIVKKDEKQASGRIRSRVHTTGVETIVLPN